MDAASKIPSQMRGEAEGAIPNGREIAKVRSEPGDANPVGMRGRVLASIDLATLPPATLAHLAMETGREVERFAYFVEWESLPGVPVGVMGSKIAEVV